MSVSIGVKLLVKQTNKESKQVEKIFEGSQCVAKRPWESFLSANNALTKNFLFISHPDFIFCGLFICPWSLGRLKNICILSKNRLFCKGLFHGFWSKMTRF